jgi:predicted kinase
MELVLFIGLQASGKSSFYAARFAKTHVHVSKDLFPNAASRDRRQTRLLEEAFAAGRSVVLDNTSPTPEVRAPLIALARRHGARVVGYYFESKVADCLARNRARSGKARVPDVALFATAKRLAPPSPAEGFDALYHVRLAGPDRFEVSDWPAA